MEEERKVQEREQIFCEIVDCLQRQIPYTVGQIKKEKNHTRAVDLFWVMKPNSVKNWCITGQEALREKRLEFSGELFQLIDATRG